MHSLLITTHLRLYLLSRIVFLHAHIKASVFQMHLCSYLHVDMITCVCNKRQPQRSAATLIKGSKGQRREVKHPASDHSLLECCWRHFLMISLGLLAGSADRLQPASHWQTWHHCLLTFSQEASICQQLAWILCNMLEPSPSHLQVNTLLYKTTTAEHWSNNMFPLIHKWDNRFWLIIKISHAFTGFVA